MCIRQDTGTVIQSLICLLMTSVCVSVAGVVHRLETDGSRYFENIFFWHKEGEGEGLHHHLGYY